MRYFRRHLVLSLALCVVPLPGLAAAPQSTTPQTVPVKIAVISFESAVLTTAEGQRDMHDLQTQFAPQREEIIRRNSDLETLKKQLQAGNWSAAEQAVRQAAIDQKQKELTQDAEDAQKAFAAAAQKVYEVLAQKFFEVAADYAKRNGFTVLLDVSGTDSPVLWAAQSTDVTKAVTADYDKQAGMTPAKQDQPSSPVSPPRAIPARIAVMNFQSAAMATNQGKQLIADVEAEFASRKADISQKTTEVETLKQQLQSAGNISDAKRASRTGVIDQKQKQLSQEIDTAQADYQAELEQRYNAFANVFFKQISDYLAQSGYTILFDKPGEKLTIVLWTAPGIQIEALNAAGGTTTDIASAVVAEFNANPSSPAASTTVATAAQPSGTPPVSTGASSITPSRGLSVVAPPGNAATTTIAIPHNYALIFATDDYTHWPHLTNPISDADAVNQTLSSLFGFEVEEVRNATDDQILRKLTEYLHRQFEPQDQLLIFFSGHGYFDPDLGKGFLVPANALLIDDDIGHRSLLAHETIMDYVNRIPARHVVLVVDACFAGTLDRRIADSGLRGDTSDVYAHATLPELLARKELKRTRRYITSGGKDFVPDGLPGHHSPFISAFLITLNQAADRKGYATLDDIQLGLNTVTPEPRWGDIQDDNEPGADFVLLTPDAIAQLTKPN
jgi:Skp family chaperone for outer membrane proteins